MRESSYPVRPEVQAFKPYTPGLSIEEIQIKYGLDSVIKMASNENPLGVSALVRQAISDAAVYAFRYPRSGNPRIVEALAAHHGIDKERIIVGNGSDEIIDLLVRVCPSPGTHNVVASNPSFSMYGIVSKLCGVEFRTVPLRSDFSFDWEGLLNAVDRTTAVVFITTPDNPSGYCPPATEVRDFASRLPDSCLLVIDEAYMDFTQNEAEYSLLQSLDEFPNSIILRTFSKSFGLAGVRLGYGIMPKKLAAHIQSVHPPFSVNILAEEAGLAALKDTVFYKKSLEVVRLGRDFLSLELEKMGCLVTPSHANFIMFTLPKGCLLTAHDVFEALLARGIIIRPLGSYGLDAHLRVSVGTSDENSYFISSLQEVIAS